MSSGGSSGLTDRAVHRLLPISGWRAGHGLYTIVASHSAEALPQPSSGVPVGAGILFSPMIGVPFSVLRGIRKAPFLNFWGLGSLIASVFCSSWTGRP